ncbi:MAG: type II secretion system GspH family protein [Chitinispirillales bacterium]|nr:type II secretion system GspH family protein [Chitinispirillales bacterium]
MNKKGFTLIEVIVVAVLLAILALGVFALFMMYTESSRETTAFMRMQRISDAFVEEIGRRVRESSCIYPDFFAAGDFPGCALDEELDMLETERIVLFNANGNVLNAYRFENGIIEEFVNAEWRPFTIDGRVIQLCNEDGPGHNHNNIFTIGTWRNRLDVVNVTFREVINGNAFHLTFEGGVFRCRL